MAYNFLLVDDSRIVRRSLKKSLSMSGLDIAELYEAENGQIGLELLREKWIDLVFLDINMPVMNGMEFIEAVRADDTLRNTAIIVVSTEGSKERIDRLLELQVKAFLRKPTTPEEIVEQVTIALGEQ